MVVVRLLPGWMTEIWISALVVDAAGAVFVRHEADVLMRAVSLRLGGLAQLDISPLT